MKNKKKPKIFLFLLILMSSSLVLLLNTPPVWSNTMTLNPGQSYDFLTNTKGEVDDGDFYYALDEGIGTFLANNKRQRGLKDLGDIGLVYLDHVPIPQTRYTRFGVPAINNHTYVSLAKEGEEGTMIIFRVNYVEPDYSTVYIQYLYKPPSNQSHKTTTYVDVYPKEISLGEQITLTGTIEPNLPQDVSYRTLHFRLTEPNGTQRILGPLISHYAKENQRQTVSFNYTPTKKGTYQIIFYTPLEVIVNTMYEPSFSEQKTFTVLEYYTEPDEFDPTPNEPDPTFQLSDFQEFLIIASIGFVIIIALILYIGYKLRPKSVWSNKKRNPKNIGK